MRILVDADSCSVKNIIETVAEDKQVPVVLFSDYNHQLTSAYSEIVTVQEGWIMMIELLRYWILQLHLLVLQH